MDQYADVMILHKKNATIRDGLRQQRLVAGIRFALGDIDDIVAVIA